MMVKEYIKVDPTKHSEELLAALPTLRQEQQKFETFTDRAGGSQSTSAGSI
jgi:hypothetical protein